MFIAMTMIMVKRIVANLIEKDAQINFDHDV